MTRGDERAGEGSPPPHLPLADPPRRARGRVLIGLVLVPVALWPLLHLLSRRPDWGFVGGSTDLQRAIRRLEVGLAELSDLIGKRMLPATARAVERLHGLVAVMIEAQSKATL